MKIRQKHLGSLVVFAAFLLSPALALRLDPHAYEGGYSRDRGEVEARNNSAIAMILGEVRANFSDLMFIKTERYMHSGVAYDAHLDMTKMASSGEVSAKPEESGAPSDEHPAHEHADHDAPHDDRIHQDHAHHEGDDEPAHRDHVDCDHDHPGSALHDHAADEHESEFGGSRKFVTQPAVFGKKHEQEPGSQLVTLIKTPAEDFRGFIGWLEREVKPWRDPSEGDYHTDGVELLPWYRLMTLSDPHNVRAYLIGAWWLRSGKVQAPDQALQFVDEGISNNPDSFQLHLMRGYILHGEFNRAAEAREAFERAADLALERRPIEGDANPAIWTTYEEDDARAAARMAVMLEKETGDPARALELAERYRTGLGGDAILERQIDELTGAAASS